MSANPASAAPRRRPRLLVFLPAALLAVVLVAFSGGWWWAQARLSTEMDARVQALRQAGWRVAWRQRTVSGFPFRLKVVLDDVSLTAPGEHAWGFAVPRMEAQAYLIQATHWVFAAPQGLTLTRPMGGPLLVGGRDLRASIAGVTASPWRFALAGDALTFAPGAGAKPFSFTMMGHAEAHLRPSADGSGDGDVFVEIDGGRAAPDSVLHRLAAGAAITLAANGRLLKLGAARGVGWGEAVAAWSAAGGAVRLDRLTGVGGVNHVDSKGGLLGVDDQGRLEGALPLTLRQDPQPATPPPPGAAPPAQAAATAAAAGASAALPVVFKDGLMRLGPFSVGPAPTIR